jgi:hypothetical protein
MDTRFEVPCSDRGEAERRLWGRVEAHRPGGAQADGFLRRLARDQRWTLDFAREAIREYRKFCFLSIVAASPVSPSKEVDEVWHLHLLYSRDYWQVWCAEVLCVPLHHHPADATTESQAACRAQYAETLVLYERFFGAAPLAFWPATHVVFGRARRRFWKRAS